MKILLLIILLLPLNTYALDWSLKYNLTTVPVNHEPIVGDKVARYRLQITPVMQIGRLSHEVQTNIWGVNKWRPRSMLGQGVVEKYSNSDWTIENYRVSLMHTTKFDLVDKRIQLFSEYYYPIDRHSWGSNPSMRHYYWLIGISGEIGNK